MTKPFFISGFLGDCAPPQVLVIEPDSLVATSVKTALQARGYHATVVVPSVELAREQLKNRRYITLLNQWHARTAAQLSDEFGVVVARGTMLISPQEEDVPACILPKPLRRDDLEFALRLLFGPKEVQSVYTC